MTTACLTTSTTPAVHAPGTVLVAGLIVDEHLSRGADLDVYSVWDPDRDCLCIAKTLRPDRREDATARRRLHHEGELLTTLDHPHLVRGYALLDGEDLDDEDSGPMLLMETLTGATVARVIQDVPDGLDTADTALLGLQLCSVLHHLHRRGVLHLDLKPSNIVCEAGRARLLDLSLAQPPGPCPAGKGTHEYMAPEQVAGDHVDTAADAWGLGGVLFRALTRRRPFPRTDGARDPRTAPDLTALQGRTDVDPDLRQVVAACLRLDPRARPGLTEVRARLATVLARTDHTSGSRSPAQG